jgi:hypothetical protein
MAIRWLRFAPLTRRAAINAAAVAGMVGPSLLGATIVGLTVAQYEFMLSLRWHPLRAPTLDWPSGLALGPYGDLLVAAFVVCGGLMLVFANGLRYTIAQPRVPTALLQGAGIALMLLAFRVDASYRTTPATWHGELHDAAYVLLGATLLPALALLVPRFRRDTAWRGHAAYTIATLLLIVPAFVFKGALFYVFLLGIVSWVVLTGLRLHRLAKH